MCMFVVCECVCECGQSVFVRSVHVYASVCKCMSVCVCYVCE